MAHLCLWAPSIWTYEYKWCGVFFASPYLAHRNKTKYCIWKNAPTAVG